METETTTQPLSTTTPMADLLGPTVTVQARGSDLVVLVEAMDALPDGDTWKDSDLRQCLQDALHALASDRRTAVA